ncbi:MAG: four helix bundle suffix domain-containing protein [Muribaculaceae bacterium]|nr:four helix bundle suffix domain-containing protein [Muribaculaceae bacterium]
MDNNKTTTATILRRQAFWEELWFYRKAVALYYLTVRFTSRFLPTYGDRTVDQMVQAARSGKQNIIEGSADGVTSTEMEIRLLNVARSSLQELREDYVDYLKSHRLPLWDKDNKRFEGMIQYCRTHNDVADYEPFFDVWTDEEMGNVAYTLCRMCDKMMTSYLKELENQFVTEGGIKERMTAARLGYRNDTKHQLEEARQEIAKLKNEIARLNQIIAKNNYE